MFKCRILFSILFVLQSFVSIQSKAEEVKEYKFVQVIKADNPNVIFFMKCYQVDDCDLMGSENGYHIEDFKFSPEVRKAGATALGVTAILGGAVLGTAIGFAGMLAIWGEATSGAGAILTFTGLFVGTVGLEGWLIATQKAVDPRYHWRRAEVSADLSKERLSKMNGFIIEDKKINKVIEVIEDILKKKDPVNRGANGSWSTAGSF